MDIGIDLGTTFSVVAVDGKVELAPDYPGGAGIYLDDCDVTIIPSPCGEQTFPSVAIEDPHNPQAWLFGTDALQKSEEGYAPVMFSKRKIGTLEEIPTATGFVTAKEVAARFLSHLKECAERALGQSVKRAVITHPAYFDRGAVEETREAARQAGFDMSLPQQLLMEPTAAALAYTRTDLRDPLRVLTYDLGGGTFDVTYMERIDGVIQIRAFDGNHLLGGYNFDKELVRIVRTRLEEKGRSIRLDENDPIDRGRLARLLRIAENVKIALADARSDKDAVEFRAPNLLVDELGRPVQVSERITRTQFVEAIRPWLDEVIECCGRALAKGKARAEDLHQILLVGGSSYGPWVADSLKVAFPNADLKLFSPDLCVGAGAAIHARAALPKGIDLGAYSIQLDVPDATALDHIHVGGQFTQSAGGSPAAAGMRVQLDGEPGKAPAVTSIGATGRFLFRDVGLTEEGSTRFVISLRDASGAAVVQHSFAISHVPPRAVAGSTEPAASVTGSTTVLPRPLYIETARGMVALAEEGVALPAKCVAKFERTNSNPNITLKLFQEHDPVGTVRITQIPEAAGVGSPVELTMEITADNQVRGEVIIFRVEPSGAGTASRRIEALRTPIDVRFDPAVIPSAAELKSQFEELRSRSELLPLFDPYLAAEVGNEGLELIEKVDRSFDHQPFERQEVHLHLRRLRNLLMPPRDEMTPTKKEFSALVGECRKGVEELRNTNGAILQELKRTGRQEIEIDGRKMSAKRLSAMIERLAVLETQLNELESSGRAAHDRKDRITWPKSFERVATVSQEIARLKPAQSGLDISNVPTPLLKVLVVEQELNRRLELLGRHARALMSKGEFEDWIGELTEIKQAIESAGEEVLQLDDTIPSSQALAQIRKVLEGIHALDARIAALGKVLH